MIIPNTHVDTHSSTRAALLKDQYCGVVWWGELWWFKRVPSYSIVTRASTLAVFRWISASVGHLAPTGGVMHLCGSVAASYARPLLHPTERGCCFSAAAVPLADRRQSSKLSWRGGSVSHTRCHLLVNPQLPAGPLAPAQILHCIAFPARRSAAATAARSLYHQHNMQGPPQQQHHLPALLYQHQQGRGLVTGTLQHLAMSHLLIIWLPDENSMVADEKAAASGRGIGSSVGGVDGAAVPLAHTVEHDQSLERASSAELEAAAEQKHVPAQQAEEERYKNRLHDTAYLVKVHTSTW